MCIKCWRYGDTPNEDVARAQHDLMQKMDQTNTEKSGIIGPKWCPGDFRYSPKKTDIPF